MKYIFLILTWLPVAMCAIGFLMRVWPQKNSFRKELCFRQYFGSLLFIVFGVLTLIEIGAYKHDDWFINTDGKYIYKVMPEPTDSVLPTDSLANDSVVSDSSFVQELTSSKQIEIPFEYKDNVRYICLNVGTAKINAVFDTGCSFAICFSHQDYYKVVGAGLTEENKFIDKQNAINANGDTTEVLMFNLKECSIENVGFQNVVAGVAESDVTLVGNGLFKGFQITIDDTNKKLILKKNGVLSSNS